MLHLEVVGHPGADGPNTAARVASYLAEQGAQHTARGEVWDQDQVPGWRVTALIAARKLTACQRGLMKLGATRVVGSPTQFVFDRNMATTFGKLRDQLAGR